MYKVLIDLCHQSRVQKERRGLPVRIEASGVSATYRGRIASFEMTMIFIPNALAHFARRSVSVHGRARAPAPKPCGATTSG